MIKVVILKLAALFLFAGIVKAQFTSNYTTSNYSLNFLKAKEAEFYASLNASEKRAYENFKKSVGILVLEDSARIKNMGFKIVRSYRFAGKKWYELPRTADNDATVDYLINSLGVSAYNLEYAIIKTQDFPDSIPAYLPYPEKKWGLKTIGFFDKSIVSLRTSENDVAKSTIFVLDTGGPCDSLGAVDHPYFLARGKIRMGGNYVPRPDSAYWHWDWTYPPRDLNGHGTHVGGIIADVNRSDSLVFVKIIGASGFGLWPWAQAGIEEAINYGLKTGRPVVVNGSFGGGPSPIVEYQLKYIDSLIVHAGLKISLVFAAGNTGTQLVIWPAAYGHRGYIPGYENGYSFITSVGAIQLDKDGAVTKASYSAFDRDVDVFAPGGAPAFYDSLLSSIDGKYLRFDSTAVLSAATVAAPTALDWLPRYYRDPRDPSTVDSLYRYLSGTSMAAPHIAGIVGWFWGRYPDFPPSELRERLKKAAISFTFWDRDSSYTFEGKYIYLPYLFGQRFKVNIVSYNPRVLTDTVGVGTKLVFRIDSVATESNELLQFRWFHNNALIGNGNSVEVIFWDAGWHTITAIVSAGEDLGFIKWSIFVNPLTTVEERLSVPKIFVLHQNYPNPFNPSTTIGYDLPKSGRVVLKVYDILGREVRTLVNEEQPAGRYSVRFDAADLPSGVYFYRLEAGDLVASKRLIIIK